MDRAWGPQATLVQVAGDHGDLWGISGDRGGLRVGCVTLMWL